MFARLVYESFRRQKRRKLLAGSAIALGVTVATAMIAVATGIGDKINRELRTFGSNIVITPQEDSLDLEVGGVSMKPPSDGAFLRETDLPLIKSIFWHHNILGFAPMLPASAPLETVNGPQAVTVLGTYFAHPYSYGKETLITGVRTTHPWWRVDGAWPEDGGQDVLAGEKLAARLNIKPGDTVTLAGHAHLVSGIVSTGSAEDDGLVAPITLAQGLLGRPGAVRRVFVSALTKPEDAFARTDPKTLQGAVYDRWYCSPYAQSIAYQLQQAIPNSHAEPIRQVSQNEGVILARVEGLLLLVAIAALLASALTVSAAMANTMFERRTEVGLMKALGAANASVASLLFAETALLCTLASLVGFGLGTVLAHQIGSRIFGSQIAVQPVVLPVVLLLSGVVTVAGSAAAIRRAVQLDPVFALRGAA